MAKIVVVGSFNLDLITYVERIPNVGETVTDGEFQTMPGGKGSNQAVAAARLGADVTFIGCIGDDRFAQIGFDLWRDCGIQTDYVIQAENTATGTALILVDAKGENLIAVAPGANRKLAITHVDAVKDVIASADVVMAQLEVSLEVVEHAFKLARQHHTPTLLNPAPVRGDLDSLLSLADIVTPNEGEAAMLKAKLMSPDQTIVTTLGAKGAEWRKGDERHTIPAFPVDVIDTVGGGDAFNGGLAVGLAEGKTLDEAVRFANAVAGLAVTKRGAASSMPQRTDVDTFLSNQV